MDFSHDYDLKSLELIKPFGREFQMWVTPRFKNHYLKSSYEGFSANLVENFAKTADLFVDIGAHYGYYSLLVGISNPDCQVFSFEPVPENYEILAKNIDVNDFKNIKAINKAISNNEEKQIFHISEASDNGGFIKHPEIAHVRELLPETELLSKVLNENIDAAVMIKIDVEGYEYEIIESIETELSEREDITLIIEYNPKCLKAAGRDPVLLLNKIKSLGYEIFLINDKTNRYYQLDSSFTQLDSLDPQAYANLVCIKRTRSINLVIFSHSASLGGAERSLLGLGSGLVQRYQALITVVLPREGRLAAKLHDSGIAYLIGDYGWWCDYSLPGNLDEEKELAKSLDWLVDSMNDIEETNPDVLVTNTIVIPWGSILAHLTNRPHLWNIREVGELDHGLEFYFPKQEITDFIKGSSNQIITNSDAVKKELFGQAKQKIKRIYTNLALPDEEKMDDGIKYYSYPDASHLLIIGQISKKKGQEDAVLATIDLVQKFEKDVELIVVGQNFFGHLDHLVKLVSDAGLENRIHFLPYQENVFPLIKQADIVLSCSRFEAFGRVPLESMLMKTAVIGTNSGGTVEQIIDGETGLLYEPGNIDQLVVQINKLIDDPFLKKTIEGKAYDYAIKCFVKGNYVDTYYERLIGIKDSENSKYPMVRDLLDRIFVLSIQEKNTILENKNNRIRNLDNLKQQLSERLASGDQKLLDQAITINGLRSTMAHLEQVNIQLKDQSKDLGKHINRLTKENESISTELIDVQSKLTNTEHTLQQINSRLLEIYHSTAWKLIKIIWKIRLLLIPKGSQRERYARAIRRILRNQKPIIEPTNQKPESKQEDEVIKTQTQLTEEKVKEISDNFLHYLYSSASGKDKADYVDFREYIFPENLEIKPIAFYLPQYHPIPENDRWWGKGFTEWTNVTKAVPQFTGHYQPHLPGELGFYDLRVPEILQRQVSLARNYGIFGFCFYYYWFDGKRLLEKPLEQFINDDEIDFPFCVCWANENWSRRWDGLDDSILISQNHTEESDLNFIHDVAELFTHPDYIKVDGRPLLLVYRAQLLPNPKDTVKRWKEYCLDHGIAEPFLVAAQVFGFRGDPARFGFDAAVEFPPNTINTQDKSAQFTFKNPDFHGRIYDYLEIMKLMREHQAEDYILYKTVMPSWDNTARKPDNPSIIVNNSPDLYQKWLKSAIRYSNKHNVESENFIFINAWNEWAEAAYLEPDRKYGYAYLDATGRAIQDSLGQKRTWTILFVSHNAHLGGAQLSLLSIIRWFKTYTNIDIKILLLGEGNLLNDYKAIEDVLLYSDFEDLPEDLKLDRLIDYCDGSPDLIYGNSAVSGKVYHWISELDVPILTHFRELESSIEKYAADWIEDVVHYSREYFTNSNATKEFLNEKYSIDKEICHTAYTYINNTGQNPLDDDEKQTERKKLGLTKSKIQIFGCGVGMPFRKGADLFYEVAQKLKLRGDKDFHFYWIGDFLSTATDPQLGVWKDYQEKYHAQKMDKIVTFLGIKDNPLDYLRCGDIFLLPSREEAIGRVTLEAAECGLPIICFDKAGGAPEFVRDDAGYSVPLADTDKMAEKISFLINDQDTRHEMGRRAYERVNHEFSESQIMPKVLSVSRNLAKKNPKVSIIVTNYNHAQYLPQRLDSIFSQTFQDFEVFLMDDASTDQSLGIFRSFNHRPDVHIISNKVNVGSPFKLWQKALPLVRGEIVWIAESDDLCEFEFLAKILPAFDNPDVQVAYCSSKIMDELGNVQGEYKDSEYLKSISRNRWNIPYCIPANQEVDEAFGIKNTILNMSAVLFRNRKWQDDLLEKIVGFNSGGDTFLLLNLMKGGKVHYLPEPLNYHRRHKKSIVGKILACEDDDRLMSYFHDFVQNKEFVLDNFELSADFFERLYIYVQELWLSLTPESINADLLDYFPVDYLREKFRNKFTQ